MRKLTVELGPDSYGITIGSGIAAELVGFVRQAGFSRHGLIVTDENVGPLYAARVVSLLKEAGLGTTVCTVPAGESSKSLAVAEGLYTKAIEAGLDRKSPIFALGGGVVGDLTGFVAATYMRGVPFVQLPTSLLAQVDSGVGGKVAVNHCLGKNLIGAFYQPRAVFMELDTLKTLPPREISTGLGEIIKYGLMADAELFSFLQAERDAILKLEPKAITHIVARSCEIKAAVVSADEKESGWRRVLNFGHTMAHAIEKETNYTRYNHGEAVAIGMVCAALISESLGLIGASDSQKVRQINELFHLPTVAEGCTVDNMCRAIAHDKKTVNGRTSWVLMEAIGKVRIESNVPEDIVRAAMRQCTAC